MKKITHGSCVLFVWLALSLSTAFAADFSLVDSDGDTYYVGESLGKVMHNDAYVVRYKSNNALLPEGEGFLYYDTGYQTLKIIIFENSGLYGFSMEGQWVGSGSGIYYLNSRGDSGEMNLYFGVLPRKKMGQERVKNIFKDVNKVK